MTFDQVEYYVQHLPLAAYRNSYGLAQLNADFREVHFPRYLGPDPKDSEPERPKKHWTPEELVPWFAVMPTDMPVEVARALLAEFDDLPDWAKELAPVRDARLAVD